MSIRKINYLINIFILLILLSSNINSLFAENSSNYSPKQVIEKFCILRAEGKYFGYKSPYWNLVIWSDEPGWDQSIMISKFKIGNVEVNGNKAKVVVSYDVLAHVWNDESFWPKSDIKIKEYFKEYLKDKDKKLVNVTNDGNIEVTYELIKGEKGWKIDNPLLPPFEYKNIVIKGYQESFNQWKKAVKRGEVSKNLLYHMRKRNKEINDISSEEMIQEEIRIQKKYISSLKSINK